MLTFTSTPLPLRKFIPWAPALGGQGGGREPTLEIIWVGIAHPEFPSLEIVWMKLPTLEIVQKQYSIKQFSFYIL